MIRVRLGSNGKYWQALWTVKGKRYSQGLGPKAEKGKRAALTQCAAIQAQLNASGMGKPPERLTLSQLRERYMRLREGEVKPGTLGLHGRAFDLLEQHFGPDRKVLTITPADMAEWRKEVADSGLAPATVSLFVTKVKAIFAWAVAMELMPRNPATRLKSSDSTYGAKAYISMDQYRTLLGACQYDGQRHLLGLCRLAGLRRGEAVRLRAEDVAAGTITVRPEGEEGTKQRHRQVPVVPELALLLGSAPKDGHIVRGELGGAVEPRHADRMIHQVIEAAGMEAWPKPLHSLRSSCENDWVTKYPWPDVCRWLGHAPQVAMRNYLRTTPEVWAKVTGASTGSWTDSSPATGSSGSAAVPAGTGIQ